MLKGCDLENLILYAESFITITHNSYIHVDSHSQISNLKYLNSPVLGKIPNCNLKYMLPCFAIKPPSAISSISNPQF
jgi:hypothetical protein